MWNVKPKNYLSQNQRNCVLENNVGEFELHEIERQI